MKKIILFLLAAVVCVPLSASAAIEDVIEATCRVRLQSGAGFSTGTGCAFEIRDGEVRILTNYHVAENSSKLQVEFWHRGHKSTTLYAASRWFSFHEAAHRDICIIAVPLADFGDYPPQIIPLAPRGTAVSPGEAIVSCGCEEGRWPSAWRGHVVDQPDAHTIRFNPKAIPGRSGSSLFDEDATQIVGLVAWHDGTYGVAMTLDELYRAFDGQPARASYPTDLPTGTRLVSGKRIVGERIVSDEKATPRVMTAGEVRRAPVVSIPPRKCVHGVLLSERCQGCSPFGFCPQQPSRPQPPSNGGSGGGVYPTQPPGTKPPAAPPAAPASPSPQFALKSELDALATKVESLLGLPSQVAGHDSAISDLLSKLKALEGAHGGLATDVENLAENSIGHGLLQQELSKIKDEAIAGAAGKVTPIVEGIAGSAVKAAEAKAAAVAAGAAVSALPALAAVGGPVGLALFGGFWLLARGVKKIGGSTAGGPGGAAPPFRAEAAGQATPASNTFAQHGPQ